MLFLGCGYCLIGVQTCDVVMARHLSKAAQQFPDWVQAGRQGPKCSLMVVSPYSERAAESKWRAVGKAWVQARQGLKEPHSQSLAAWRTLYRFGEMVDRNLFLFRDRYGGQEDFFCLIPADTLRLPQHNIGWIMRAAQALVVHWHTMHGGGPFHASGVERHGNGYLFLGSAGAGKSTVADLSKQAQGTIVHEDRVMLSFYGGRCRLSHTNNQEAPVLRAVFVLRKSATNRLVALAPLAVGAGMAKALVEYAIGQNMLGPWVRQAFHNLASIARSVPGYELHFRKSPDFWDMIDAELGD